MGLRSDAVAPEAAADSRRYSSRFCIVALERVSAVLATDKRLLENTSCRLEDNEPMPALPRIPTTNVMKAQKAKAR